MRYQVYDSHSGDSIKVSARNAAEARKMGSHLKSQKGSIVRAYSYGPKKPKRRSRGPFDMAIWG
jgi:hypothetical protein